MIEIMVEAKLCEGDGTGGEVTAGGEDDETSCATAATAATAGGGGGIDDDELEGGGTDADELEGGGGGGATAEDVDTARGAAALPKFSGTPEALDAGGAPSSTYPGPS
jgi:hypothetical protein